MSVTINLDNLMKDISSLTIDSMTIPLQEFDNARDVELYYQNHLNEILKEYDKNFKILLQEHIKNQVLTSFK
ncbi:hypothetical protein [Enterococcus sp. AZ103]|uniref:hypothetical protein n=1 Tax=Enterococcus sp. AZ103 TaxID=2774628 RepID=UPI003F1EB95B